MYRGNYADAELHLVGGYDEHNDIFRNWQERGWLEGVTLHGALLHDDLAALLDQMSCLVHPVWEDTFGNILLEAMSRCVPCIGGKDSGAVPDVMGHGKYGLVFNIRDAKSIYETMILMNKNDIYQNIQHEATKILKENYSSDIIVKKHVELFSCML